MRGQEFRVENYHNVRSEKRVYFYDENGNLQSIPIDWTDMSSPDPFLLLSNGKSLFRVSELLSLCWMLEKIDSRVKEITP
ncbi:MAG: Y4bD/Y4pK family protein [Candidatus Sabulitectum sp.]|nr:Y4bD/Y4pK family protein [Candidatus Sabulitectum sp.]